MFFSDFLTILNQFHKFCLFKINYFMTDYVFNYVQYKKKLNKGNNNFLIIFLVIILLLGCIVFLKPIKLKTNKIYFIQADEFQTYHNSKIFSDNVIKNGDAGYIYFNKNYHVLISFHSKKSEAESKLKDDKLQYKKASVFSLELKEFSNQKKFNKSQNNAIKNFISQTEKILFKLEDSYQSLLSKNIDLKSFSSHMQNNKRNFVNVYNKLLKSFNSDPSLNLAKKHAYKMMESISNLSSNLEEISLYLINYEVINFVLNRHQFLSCF